MFPWQSFLFGSFFFLQIKAKQEKVSFFVRSNPYLQKLIGCLKISFFLFSLCKLLMSECCETGVRTSHAFEKEQRWHSFKLFVLLAFLLPYISYFCLLAGCLACIQPIQLFRKANSLSLIFCEQLQEDENVHFGCRETKAENHQEETVRIKYIHVHNRCSYS